jgi:hypothetical protein
MLSILPENRPGVIGVIEGNAGCISLLSAVCVSVFTVLSILPGNRTGSFDVIRGDSGADCISLISVVAVGALVILTLLPEKKVGFLDATGGDATGGIALIAVFKVGAFGTMDENETDGVV